MHAAKKKLVFSLSLFLATMVYVQGVSAAPNTNAKSIQSEALEATKSTPQTNTTTSKNEKLTKDKEAKAQAVSKSIKLEIKNGKTIFKTENQEEQAVELTSEETETSPIKMQNKDGSGEIKISTKKDSFVISKSKVRARTNFPLTVNFETNELQVTTPKGTKTVTILPDKAIEGMLKAGIVDQITSLAEPLPDSAEGLGPELVEGSESANLLENTVELTTDSKNSLVYKIEGEKIQKVFGIIPVRLKKTAYVSAENGTIVPASESLINKVLNLLTF